MSGSLSSENPSMLSASLYGRKLTSGGDYIFPTIYTRVLNSPKACCTPCSLLCTLNTVEMCICYTAFHATRQLNTKVISHKNVQHSIYVLNMRHDKDNGEKPAALKAFTVIMCSMLSEKQDNSQGCVQTHPHQTYLCTQCQGQKIKLWCTETLLIYCFVCTLRGRWKAKLFCYKLGWAWSLIKISLSFQEAFARRVRHWLGHLQTPWTIQEVQGCLVLALRRLCSETHPRASSAFLPFVPLLFQYVRNAKLSWPKTERLSNKSKRTCKNSHI